MAIINLGAALPQRSSDLPGKLSGKAQLTPATRISLLDLAPSGVYRASGITPESGGLLHHRFTLTFPNKSEIGGILSVALSVSHETSPLGSTLLYGVRTFLPFHITEKGDRPTYLEYYFNYPIPHYVIQVLYHTLHSELIYSSF